jgi:prolyl-tRNA synthetase
MGCYGLGIGRTVAAAIEQSHDDDGIIWPMPIAPFEVVVTQVGREDNVRAMAEDVYRTLIDAGIDALLDDRDERPGVKFKDADLIGFPLRIAVGAKSLAAGNIEWSWRKDRAKQLGVPKDVAARIIELIRNARTG